MSDDNVVNMDAYRLADLIVKNWMDAYSDNGAIWRRSQDALDLVKRQVSPELWDRAMVIARRRCGDGEIY